MSDSSDEEVGTGKKDWGIPDIFRKVLVAGAGALFMTEEGIRSVLGESKIPKDMVTYLVGQVTKSKQDLIEMITHEVRGFLESGAMTRQMQKVLASTSLEITTRVRFVPEEGHLQPRAESEIRVKTSDKSKTDKDAS